MSRRGQQGAHLVASVLIWGPWFLPMRQNVRDDGSNTPSSLTRSAKLHLASAVAVGLRPADKISGGAEPTAITHVKTSWRIPSRGRLAAGRLGSLVSVHPDTHCKCSSHRR